MEESLKSATSFPETDPTPIFELFRGSHATEILVAAVCHLKVFDRMADGPQSWIELKEHTGLAERPMVVLVTALQAMGLLEKDDSGNYSSTPIAREHLGAGAGFGVDGYLGLAAESPGVLDFVARLRSNKPRGAEDPETGAAFIFKEGMDSAMDREAEARHLTLSLAGRANNVAPHLAANLDLSGVQTLLDVGGGSGIYSIALVQANPGLRAIVMDGPEVLKVAAEFVEKHGVGDRVELLAGDMFADDLPECDAVLLSNILHDWDVPECEVLLKRCAGVIPVGGRVLIHDVFLDDTMDGPLPLALYSASLFSLTEGRVYSAAEYRTMLEKAGLEPLLGITKTLVHCGVLEGFRKH
jgi:ubiquinone/menaquinone biosynthesis C-methylase UbiE